MTATAEESESRGGLNVRELLVGDVSRLELIKRFSTSHVVHHQSVAEHSYFVALYAMFIAEWVAATYLTEHKINNGYAVLMGGVLQRALIHDIEESRTGDIPRPFKHSNKMLLAMLDQHAEKQVDPILEKIYPDECKHFIATWKRSKDATKEGRIVALADFMSVLAYMMRELSLYNATMYDNWDSMVDYVAEFSKPEYDFLRPIVNQVDYLLKEAFAKGAGDKYAY